MLFALLKGPDGTADTVGYARSGGGIYGQRNHAFLKPCSTLKAQVRHVHEVKAGVPVGYDRSWSAPEDTLVATLAIGFADGFERELSNTDGAYGVGGYVYLNGMECKVRQPPTSPSHPPSTRPPPPPPPPPPAPP